MKNKLVIIVLIILVIVGATIIGFYFNKQPANSFENTALPNQNETNNQISGEESQNKLITDDFEITLPAGWQKTEPPIGSSAMAIKMDENLNDTAAQKINFRTYFAVSYETTQGKSLNEYMQTLKNQLQQTVSGITFTQEHDVVINNRTAKAFEANFNQKEVDFKVLMVVIKGLNDDVWVISFNTLQSTWNEYQETFSNIVNSFKLKLKN